MYKLIKKYYNIGIYTNNDVAKYVVHGTITPEQYAEITGETYTTQHQ